jgi:LacI family gluconate utilization system Gnt-I transcriptional repressor
VGRAVAVHLQAKGRRRLAVVGGNDERAVRRTEAFRSAAQALGLAEVRLVTVAAPTTLRSGRDALARLLSDSGDIDAVFCSSDLLALGVLTEARVQGVGVPQQLAVIGFGDLQFAADLDPALSTVHIKGAAIGRQAAQFIVDRVEGREVPQRVIDIGFSIIERSSS